MLHSSNNAFHEYTWNRLLWSDDAPFMKNKLLLTIIIVFVIIWILLAIHPSDRKDWFLENILLILFIGVLAFTYRIFAFSGFSYLLLAIFLVLHAVGAHYAYHNTPLDIAYKHMFHAKRGIYDRTMHLAFGLLVAYPVREFLSRVVNLRGFWLYALTVTVLLTSSATYEILEMCVAEIANPKLAGKYLGIQGDPLDTQKDMSMALIGSLLSNGAIVAIRCFKLKKEDEINRS